MEQEFPVPGCENYFITEAGQVISYARGSRKILRPSVIKTAQGRLQIRLGRKKQALLNRTVAAAKYGRWPETWEHVRHLDGDRMNNRMDNLEIGCALLNVIDDIEKGSRETSVEYIEEAIKRLQAIKKARS